MPERNFRLKTPTGMSAEVSLDSLKARAESGEIPDTELCTSDNGKTWQTVSSLAGSSPVVQSTASSGPTTESSASANETTQRASSETLPPVAPSGRKLKRLPVSSVKSRYVKPLIETEDTDEKNKALSKLVGKELSGGRYKVLSQFGSGSMAYVFRASDDRLETDVVIKVPKPEKITSDDFRERFRRESQLLVRLSHPHVVKVLDVGEFDDLPYVVMQLLSGGTLSDRMRKHSNDLNQMSANSLQTWVREVARALDFCYRKGMVHRDVKPANILFDDDHNPYVSDFGLTKIMHGEHTELCSSGTANGVVLGTPNYLPPEIILGAKYDGRADQYSLAMTVYHALCGRPPMQGKSATATMINQTQKKLELISSFRTDVPKELALAVQKGIEKNPVNRFDSCESFADAVLEGLRPDSSSSSFLRQEFLSGTSSDSSQQRSSSSMVRRKSSSSSRQARPGMSGSSDRRIRRKPVDTAAVISSDAHPDWVDPAATKLPPRRNSRAKARARRRVEQKSNRLTVFGQEVPPVALAATVALFVLPTAVFFGFWTMGSSTGSNSASYATSQESEASSTPEHNSEHAERTNSDNERPEQNPQPRIAEKPDGRSLSADNIPPVQTPGAGTDTSTERNFEDDDPSPSMMTVARPDSSAEDSPKRPPARATSASPDGSAEPEAILDSFPLGQGQTWARGRLDSPHAVIGNRVWDVQKRKQVAVLEGSVLPDALTAISPDGRFFAAATRAPGQQNTSIDVWRTSTGKKKFTAKGDPTRYVEAMALSNSRLYLGDRWSDELTVWDLESKNVQKPLKVKKAKYKSGNTAISGNGQFVATYANNQLGVFRTKDGAGVVALANPRSVSRKPEKVEAFYNSLKALGFSPDGSEVAGLANPGSPKLLCWNGRGELVVDTFLNLPTKEVPQLHWIPDKSAWLIGNSVFHRQSSKFVATAIGLMDEESSVHLVDNSHIAGRFHSQPDVHSIVDIPWMDIDESFTRSLADPEAILGRGTRVEIRVTLPDETRELESRIRNSLRDHLSDNGLKVEKSGDVVFQVRVVTEEEAFVPNRSLQMVADSDLYELPLSDSDAVLVLEFFSGSKAQPQWSAILGSADQYQDVLGSAPEDTDRIIRSFEKTIVMAAIPYYISSGTRHIALPAILTPKLGVVTSDEMLNGTRITSAPSETTSQ